VAQAFKDFLLGEAAGLMDRIVPFPATSSESKA
jgi:hypothetical protein